MSRATLFVISPSNTLFSYLSSKTRFSSMYHTCSSYHTTPFNLHYHTPCSFANTNITPCHHYPIRKTMDFNAFSTAASFQNSPAPSSVRDVSNRLKKKARRDSPEGVLRHKLDMCSKNCDLVEALSLYDEAQKNGIQLTLHHYNIVLYLCASNGSTLGFDIFKRMVVEKVSPNEATFTSVARLAAAIDDPDMAFDLVKQMKVFGIPPKLRSYGPALFGFCKKGDTDKAYEIDLHMSQSGVIPEESELSALLKLSAEKSKPDKVYEMLHRLRASVRQVSEGSFSIIEDWFNSETAKDVGQETWDVNKVKDGVLKGGGGWHGQGWLGDGKWHVARTRVDENGVCQSCGEKLVCVDIDPKETENFATKLANLAYKKETKGDFVRFQVLFVPILVAYL
ncbi:hypothetical protein ACFE04_023885 [Oxalis oulophora]